MKAIAVRDYGQVVEMSKTYQQYEVTADQETGEWLEEPRHVGEVESSDWDAKQDTDEVHYDTYEEPIRDESGELTLDTETRAIAVIWQD